MKLMRKDFSKDDWLRKSQIKAFFSRMSSSAKIGRLDDDFEDEECMEEVLVRTHIVHDVIEDLNE